MCILRNPCFREKWLKRYLNQITQLVSTVLNSETARDRNKIIYYIARKTISSSARDLREW